MQTFHQFKNCESFQEFLRSGKYPDCHKGGCLDYVKVGNVLYTMEEYDMAGCEVRWSNKKYSWTLLMETEDRYEKGYADARIEESPAFWIRNDIVYAE